MPHEFKLAFATVACTRCKSRRISGAPCPDCGLASRSGEVNPNVVLRRQALRSARAQVPSVAPVDFGPFFRDHRRINSALASCLDRVLGAFKRLASEPMSEVAQLEFAMAAAEHDVLDSYLRDAPPTRPYLLQLKTLRIASDHIRRMRSNYEAAFETELPISAQKLASQAQKNIDEAANAFKSMNETQRAAGLLDSVTNAPELMRQLKTLTKDVYGLESVMDLETAGANKFHSSQVSSGQGLSLFVLDLVAAVYLDPEHFNTTMARADGLLTNHLDQVLVLGAEDIAVLDLAVAKASVYEAFQVFAQTVSEADTDDRVLRRILRLYADVFEGAALPVMAWCLKISGQRSGPYSSLRAEDATSLAKSVQANSVLAEIFAGANPSLRTAASHGLSFHLSEDEAVFELRSFKETVAIEVIVDTLMALVESLVAVLWVLDNQLSLLGVPPVPIESTLAFGPFDLANFWLSDAYSLDGSGADGNKWWFSLPEIAPAQLVTAGTVAMRHGPGISCVEVECSSAPLGVLEMKLSAFSNFIAADISLGRARSLVALAQMFNNATLNGASALRAETLRQAAAVAGLELLDRNDVDLILAIRILFKIAEARSQTEVAKFCGDAIRAWRGGEAREANSVRRRGYQWIESARSVEMPSYRLTRILCDS